MRAKNREILLNEISDNFVQYLMKGDLSSFTKKIDPNLNINNIRTLLKIHFVLTENEKNGANLGVIDFVADLNEKIKRLKTTVKSDLEIFKGKIVGRVNWKKTITKRNKYNPDTFICERREKDYNIPENLILKRMLQIIYKIVYQDLQKGVQGNYKWLKNWVSEKKLRIVLKKIFLKNAYLKRIDLSELKITQRMINRTKKSRIPLYRDAAILLSKFRRLMNYQINKKEAKELLQNTFIAPDKMYVLFELYWIIKIIRQFEGNDIKFELIEPRNNLIAQWKKKEYIYKIYHDSIGSFKFRENISDIRKFVDKDGFLKRELKVIEELEKMTEKNLSDTLWGGRPDILLEKYHKEDKTENLISLFIGEVKYTDSMRYAIKGLRELLEYIALVKNGDGDKENYLEKNSDNLFQNMENIEGGLFIDRIEGLTLGTGEKIKIFKFGDNNLDFFLGL